MGNEDENVAYQIVNCKLTSNVEILYFDDERVMDGRVEKRTDGKLYLTITVAPSKLDSYDPNADEINFVQTMGVNGIFKELFTILEDITDMEKKEVSTLLRDETNAPIYHENHLEFGLLINEDRIIT